MCENGYYYVEISKGIYGLPQAGLLAQAKLVKLLQQNGYHMMPNTPCLFRHESRNIIFSLVVDDFGIKYVHESDVKHLIDTLQSEYVLHIDWTAADYIGLKLEWDYQARVVTISMPGCIKDAIARFGNLLGNGAKSSMVYETPKYGQRIQLTEYEEIPQRKSNL